jgi:hypothetical protein
MKADRGGIVRALGSHHDQQPVESRSLRSSIPPRDPIAVGVLYPIFGILISPSIAQGIFSNERCAHK